MKARRRLPEIALGFEPRDLWIGVYWNVRPRFQSSYGRLDIYLCLLPMFPIRLRWEWGW